MHLANEPVGKGKSLLHTLQAVLQRGNMVGNLYNIVKRDTAWFFQFEKQEVG
ncbi:MAG: hypothetical protein Q7I97_09955 [Thermovirgaceae bacterium]|nr:hypothetical protein [Thermovirgaceae bacterium]